VSLEEDVLELNVIVIPALIKFLQEEERLAASPRFGLSG
jgi:hypothetical protein